MKPKVFASVLLLISVFGFGVHAETRSKLSTELSKDTSPTILFKMLSPASAQEVTGCDPWKKVRSLVAFIKKNGTSLSAGSGCTSTGDKSPGSKTCQFQFNDRPQGDADGNSTWSVSFSVRNDDDATVSHVTCELVAG